MRRARGAWHAAVLAALLVLDGAGTAGAQQYITPQQAVQAVRAFWNSPGLQVSVRELCDVPWYSGEGPVYDLDVEAPAEKAGAYSVNALVPVVISFNRWGEPEAAPTLTLQEAQSAAWQIATQHYPRLLQGQWYTDQPNAERNQYWFSWTPVLNSYGTYALPMQVTVAVDGTTGALTWYQIPADPDRILGPTVPRLTSAQARAIAAQYADYDLRQVPFADPALVLVQDILGIQTLRWIFRQFPPRPEGWPRDPDPTGVHIDAITGALDGIEQCLGGRPAGTRANPRKRPSAWLRLCVGPTGAEVVTGARPIIRSGRLWVRTEVLRAFGATVQADRAGATVTVDCATTPAAALGARWLGYGWWVPLARTARTLGWRVQWHGAEKTAIVTPSTPPRTGTDSAQPAGTGPGDR